MEYHPQYFNNSCGVRDCLDRFLCIKPFIKENSTVLDLGTSGGYMAFAAEDQCKAIVTAVDKEESLINQNKDVAKHYKSNVEFMVGDISMFDIPFGTVMDTIFYLSTHHHVIQQYDWDNANKYLMNISKSCNQLIFDVAGKGENCKAYGWWLVLPKDWDETLAMYLLDNTDFDMIEVIGKSQVHSFDRMLYRLWRNE